MSTLIVAVGSFFGFILAYRVYGYWLGHKILHLDDSRVTPSHALRDDLDYAPCRRGVLFGHHFTSIAGTGPIVGPAIAVCWGWLPALLWVVFGSIFVGAVHDFVALVISMRNNGKSMGDVAEGLISWRVKILFCLLLILVLTIVVAVFCSVIANVFITFKGCVLGCWVSIPVACVIGIWNYRVKGNLFIPVIMALALLYTLIWIGTYYLPLSIPSGWGNPVMIWTVLLLVYCFCASVLPVWLLLQPRDYVNAYQLLVILVLLIAGMIVSSLTGHADLIEAAPAIIPSEDFPEGGMSMFPFLFITVACGAVSGFHALVAGGTSSKQIDRETDALPIGYGSMLMEGALAVLVILACCAGIGMGDLKVPERNPAYEVAATAKIENVGLNTDQTATEKTQARLAWEKHYDKSWSEITNTAVSNFVEGGGNFLYTLGFSLIFAQALMGAFITSFASTTLDTATRLQRYLLQELGIRNVWIATALVVLMGGLLAMLPSPAGDGKAIGMLLWPIFGIANQILASLTLVVAMVYLKKNHYTCSFLILPFLLMTIIPAWALCVQIYQWYLHPESSVLFGTFTNNHLLIMIGVIILTIQAWILWEGAVIFFKLRREKEDLIRK